MNLKKAAGGAKETLRHMREHKVQALFFVLLLAVALASVLAPLGVRGDSFDLGNAGVVGGSEHAGQISAIDNPVVRLVYQFGDVECHQRDSRSLFLDGKQMPFCARCTAIFVGLPLGMLAFFAFRRELNPLYLILAFVPLGADGLLQALTSYESNNVLRVATGAVAGLAAGYALAYLTGEIGAIARSRRKSPR